MAQGFKDIQTPDIKEDAGYETIFEKVKAEAGAETKFSVLSFTEYAVVGSCLTLSTNTWIAFAPPALLERVKFLLNHSH